jgi:hypothetical protein
MHTRSGARRIWPRSVTKHRCSPRLSVLNRVLRHDIRTQAQLIQSYTDRMVADDLPMESAAEGIETPPSGEVGTVVRITLPRPPEG